MRIAVRDISSALPERRDADADMFGGRGIAMVDRIASRWGTEQHAGGKVVWAELTRTSDQ